MPSRSYEDNILSPKYTPQEDEKLVEVMWDEPRIFMESFLWINSKEHGMIPFRMRDDQVLVYNIIQRLRRAGRKIRLIILKGRQVGISTLIESLIFTFCRLRRDTNGLIIAQLQRTSDVVYDMFQTFYDKLPDEIRPQKERRTTSQLKLSNMRSSIKTATAKEEDPARGFALHCVHGTEVAFWEDAKATIDGLISSLPKEKGSLSFAAFESTARDMERYFFTFWNQVIENYGEDTEEGWVPIFLPWWIHTPYESDLNEREKTVVYAWENLSKTERDIVNVGREDWLKAFPEIKEMYDTYDFERWQRKLKWRRMAIRDDFGNSEAVFNSELATTPETAFLAQGQTILNKESIIWFMKNTRREGVKGCLRMDDRGMPVFVEEPDSHGEYPLTVYHFPLRGETYGIGADSALGSTDEGERRRAEESTSDYSTAEVISMGRTQAAEFRRRLMEPYDFAEVLSLLGTWYNMAPVNLEGFYGGGNSSGYASLQRLKEIYPFLTRWERVDDAISGKQTGAVGWEPTPKAMQQFLGEMMRALKHGAGVLKEEDGEVGWYDKGFPRLVIYSNNLLSELLSYKLLKDGGMGAKKGKHDDLVRAFGLALLALKQIGPPSEFITKEEKQKFIQDLAYDRFGKVQRDPGYPGWLTA